MDSNDKILLSGSNVSLDLSLRSDKSVCILVFMRTAQCLFLYTRISSVLHRKCQTCGAFLTICLRLALGKFLLT